MISENPSGGENQQETESISIELDAQYIVGFTDGEDCFCRHFTGTPLRTDWVIGRSKRSSRSPGTLTIEPCSSRSSASSGADPSAVKGAAGVTSMSSSCPASMSFTGTSSRSSSTIHSWSARWTFSGSRPFVRGLRRKDHLDPREFEQLVCLAPTMKWPRQAMHAHTGRRTRRILRDCTPSSSPALPAMMMIQSDPHGDMGS